MKPLRTLKRRADFLRVGRGRRVHGPVLTLQAAVRTPTDTDVPMVSPRVGFTVTKRVGNAVERNRIRRRLRAAARLSEALPTHPETDYVVVARRDVLTVPFVQLLAELETSVRRSTHRAGLREGQGSRASR